MTDVESHQLALYIGTQEVQADQLKVFHFLHQLAMQVAAGLRHIHFSLFQRILQQVSAGFLAPFLTYFHQIACATSSCLFGRYCTTFYFLLQGYICIDVDIYERPWSCNIACVDVTYNYQETAWLYPYNQGHDLGSGRDLLHVNFLSLLSLLLWELLLHTCPGLLCKLGHALQQAIAHFP